MPSAELRAEILAAAARIFWWRREPSGSRLAGHAYLTRTSGQCVLAHLVHSPESTPTMIALAREWEARHPPASDLERLRAQVAWYPPETQRFSFHMDGGAVERLLADAVLVHRHVLGPDPGSFADLPEEFLRAPVRACIRSLVGELAFGELPNADEVRPYFHHARSGDTLAISACRYGSRHADAGQDRTAVIWLSRDAGRRFTELPWTLPLAQSITPSGQCCWPPEQLDRIVLDAGRLEVEWEDPWIAYEPGHEWAATWDAREQHWVMKVRGGWP